MFTSNKRVIRNGYLVAFEGEVMSDEEAERRGLVGEPPAEEKPKRTSRRRAQTEDE